MKLKPNKKLQVFISSICGVSRYDNIRAELKKSIEATDLAQLYLFEKKGASTLPAGAHYTFSLKESDVCIFLIDNKDGISQGVQKEIDTVKKHGIKMLCYFCDEREKEQTPFQKSLTGAQFAKSKVVHSFEELSRNGAQDLIDDIIEVYCAYCANEFCLRYADLDSTQKFNLADFEKYKSPTFPKTMLKNVDKCSDYLLKFVTGSSFREFTDTKEQTSKFDYWGLQFLPTLFESQPIQKFNTSMYLDVLESEQEDHYFQIVKTRWQAIQSYFTGNTEKCIEHLESALSQAKSSIQPSWVINDILIDLRNQQWINSVKNNKFSDAPAQIELENSKDALYYPILDRVNESLNEKFISDLYKNKVTSPYTVIMGNDLQQYGNMLASAFIVSMYNGSLTHILQTYKNLKYFAFYLTSRYDHWDSKLALYTLTIFEGSAKEIKNTQNSFPEILNQLSAEEANEIIDFCNNHAVSYKRLNSQLTAFGQLGYILTDDKFDSLGKLIVSEISAWLDSDSPAVFVGSNIFPSLEGVAKRISQDKLSEICCKFIKRHYSRWYVDMFKFIASSIDLRKMSDDSAAQLVEHINYVLDNEKERDLVNYSPTFLCMLRQQNRAITKSIDEKVQLYFPKYYDETYRIATTENKQQDLPKYLDDMLDLLRKHNKIKNQDGVYLEFGINEIAAMRSILLEDGITHSPEKIDSIISSVVEALLFTNENISVKLDAISLLISIIVRYTEAYKRNLHEYNKLSENIESIKAADSLYELSNINNVALQIGLQLLFAAMGKDVYGELLELFPCIQSDIPTTIAVTKLLFEYLENSETIRLPKRIEAIVLQNVLQWLNSEHLHVRIYATKILLTMSRNEENYGIVNQQLIRLIDTGSMHSKILILRNLSKMDGLSEATKNYIFSKCEHDANYLVRKFYNELEE